MWFKGMWTPWNLAVTVPARTTTPPPPPSEQGRWPRLSGHPLEMRPSPRQNQERRHLFILTSRELLGLINILTSGLTSLPLSSCACYLTSQPVSERQMPHPEAEARARSEQWPRPGLLLHSEAEARARSERWPWPGPIPHSEAEARARSERRPWPEQSRTQRQMPHSSPKLVSSHSEAEARARSKRRPWPEHSRTQRQMPHPSPELFSS